MDKNYTPDHTKIDTENKTIKQNFIISTAPHTRQSPPFLQTQLNLSKHKKSTYPEAISLTLLHYFNLNIIYLLWAKQKQKVY